MWRRQLCFLSAFFFAVEAFTYNNNLIGVRSLKSSIIGRWKYQLYDRNDPPDVDVFANSCKIKVVGVGGGGSNAVNR